MEIKNKNKFQNIVFVDFFFPPLMIISFPSGEKKIVSCDILRCQNSGSHNETFKLQLGTQIQPQ